MRDDGPVKVSRSLKENAMKGWRAEELLRKKNGRDPTMNEISTESGVPVEDLLAAFDAVAPPASLYAGTSDKDGNETSLLDKVPTRDREGDIIDRIMVEDLLRTLNNRERQILVLRYFRGKTQSETAKVIGVSQVQISRIEKAALKNLRELAGY